MTVYSMVKIKNSSVELDRFLSRVYVSLKHTTSFMGLDKLYHTAKNQFSSVTRKEIRKWAENNLSYIHYTNPLEEPSNETRCILLKLIVYGKLIWLLYKM